MKLFRWNAESHNFLSSETRIQHFDFERVAKAVRIRYNHLSCEVTPDECRLAYAGEFTEKFLPDMLKETSGLNIDDSMTFDEVMNVVERRNERNELRKKKTFDSILASLGPRVMSSDTESVELDMIKSNIAVKRMKEQNERSKRNEITTKRNEAARLENEREILRQRLFIPESEFRYEGVLQDTVMTLYLDAESDLKFPDAVEDDAKCSGSVTDDDMDHADLVLGDDLDAVLEEVEKELDLQAEEKGQSRGVEVRSELYEVLALLERASVNKEREGVVVNKEREGKVVTKEREEEVVNEEREEEVVNQEREGEEVNKMQKSITIAVDTPKPFRTTSSRAAAVLAREPSVLLDGRKDSLLTTSSEEELSTPPPFPPPPPEETAQKIGDEGLFAMQPVKGKNQDEAQSMLSCDDPRRVCAPSLRTSDKMQSRREIECEEVRDDHSDCGSVDSQGTDDWVDSRSSLEMKALLYRSCPVILPPSVPSCILSSSSEADMPCAITSPATPTLSTIPITSTSIPIHTTPATPTSMPAIPTISITNTPPTSTAGDAADGIHSSSQSNDRHSSDTAQAPSTPLKAISTQNGIHQMALEDSLACGQQSCVVALALTSITPTTAYAHQPVRTSNGMDQKGGGSDSERCTQVRMSGSLLSSRSGPRNATAPRILRPAG